MLRPIATCLLLLMLLGAALAEEAASPSFDCRKAVHADEKTICADVRLSELDRLQASGFAKAQYHPKKKEILKTTKEFLGYRRDCKSDRECIRRLQVSLIHHYIDAGLSFSLPTWAAAEGISADASCDGIALKPIKEYPFSLKKGDEIDFIGYEDEDGERHYVVYRAGRIRAADIRLKDSNCILRRYY